MHPSNKKLQISSQLKIIDTFLCRQHKIQFKDLHIQRVIDSYNYFKYPVDREPLQKLYDEFENDIEVVPGGDLKIRVEFSLNKYFEFKTDVLPLDQLHEPLELIPAKFGVQAAGLGIGNYKTTDRDYWNQNQSLIMNVDAQDILGLNEFGKVTETSRFNLFFQVDEKIYTPTLQSGCLDGVFRKFC